MSSTSKRLPVSCENCRQRKIRCLSSQEQAPCDTCVRRGYEATCFFKRESFSQTPALGGALVTQISVLTNLLKQNISLTSASLDRDRGRDRDVQALPTPEPKGDTPVENSDTNSLASPTGRLLTSASNHVRCAPFNRLGDAGLLESMQQPLSNPLAGFPFSEENQITRYELLQHLPSFRHCDKLKEIFLDVFSPLFHILHEPTFEAKYREFKREPQSTSLSFIALLFVVLSLGATSLDDDSSLLAEIAHGSALGASARGLAAAYRLAAMRCLSADNFMSQHNLCTLQSLVLLVYSISHTGGPVWSLLGSTLHIAIAIGCSVDPDQLDVDLIEAEERRRCWAALMMLYTVQSTCFGNIMPFRVQADVALPANVNDEELFDATNATRSSLLSSPQRLTQMSYLLCKFNLSNIGFEICRISSSTPLPPRDLVLKLDQQLAAELKKHISLFENFIDMPFYHVAHFYIVSNYTHHLLLLLHRPYLGIIDSTSSSETLDSQILESRQRCNESAMKILSNFESFHLNPELKPYHWYINGFGSFQAFTAITTLLVIMAKRDIPPTSNLAMATAIRSCMGILRDMSVKSEICAKALGILEPSVQRQISEVQKPTLESASFATPSTFIPNSDVWGDFPNMESYIRDIPSEQWLFPSAFPWGDLR